MKELWKVAPALAPILCVGGVALGAAVSLGGYMVPAYSAEDFQPAEDGSGQVEEAEVQEAEDIQSQEDAGEDSPAETKTPVAAGSFDLEDGVYEGSAQGFSGLVTVSVTIKDKSITAIDVLDTSDDDVFFNRARAVIDSILETQSLEVDAVSGATYSSRGIINAVKDALGQEPEESQAAVPEVSAGAGTVPPASSGAVPAAVGQGNFNYADGTYEGSAEGFSGTVRVSVTVKDKTITAIDVLDYADDESFFSRAREGVIGSILSSQSLEVDTVSGATYSSRGIINAVKNALGSAGSAGSADEGNVPQENPTPTTAPVITPMEAEEEGKAYKDGIYTGVGTGFSGEIKVEVTVSGGKIEKITILESKDGDGYIAKASALLGQIVQQQSTNVDTVSGATYSSNGLIEAVRDALSKAAMSGVEETPTPTPSEAPGVSGEPASSPTNKPAVGEFPYPDGTYTGIGEGFGGEIIVSVVIENQAIKSVQVTSHEYEDDAFFGRAEVLTGQIVENQSIQVDTISGATYSSKGILAAVENALEAAKKAAGAAAAQKTPTPGVTKKPAATTAAAVTASPSSPAADPGQDGTPSATGAPGVTAVPGDPVTPTGAGQASGYVDGRYPVSVTCEPDEYWDFDPYSLSLALVVENGKIATIEDLSGNGDPDNEAYMKRAANGTSLYQGIISQILEKNGVENIDTVSRATCSSKAIIEACRQALELAAGGQ